MFTAEVRQATTELRRPAAALFTSGAVAGASIGLVVLLLGTALAQQSLQGAAQQFAVGAIYATGFTLAILARTDLFTEYTTISVFPLLTGDVPLSRVARLWALVYLGNLFGGAVVVLLGASLGGRMGFLAAEEFGDFAHHLASYRWWVIIGSGFAAGWLMGLLSWLIAGGRDTISQIIFIWIIGVMIGVLGLHHAITGGVEVMIAALGSAQVGAREVLHVILWATVGNSLGGVAFALTIQQAVRMGDAEPAGEAPSGEKGDPVSRRRSER